MRNMKTVKDPVIQKILQMPCKFQDYEVAYDDEQMMKFYQRRAKLCGVKVSETKPHQTDYETCEGTVENCIRYLRDYIEGDYGYQAGQCLNIVNAPKTPEFKAEFQHFIEWLTASKRFNDFGVGVKAGDMANYLK